MKKVIAIILCLAVAFCFSVTAMAAGTDDGSILVAEKQGEKFFGTEAGKGIFKYLAANGSGETFYDLNGDRTMNICDLVALSNNEADIDQNGVYSPADGEMLRNLLIK